MKHVVVLGGGYGGLAVVDDLLDKDIANHIEITLVDRMPFQGLKTEYYALASGTASDIEIRNQFPTDPRLTKAYGEVTSVDLEKKQVCFLEGDPLSYDVLVIALGCVDKFHNIPGAEMFSCSIQSLSATRKTNQRVNDVKPYGTVSIIGGGLSGVEMAAELRESRPDLNVRILDRGKSILSPFPDKLQQFVRVWFEKHDIDMVNGVSVSRLEEGVIYNQGEMILTDATVWTAGIQPSPVVQQMDVPKDPQGRVLLNEFHQIPQHPDVYVVGDCASLAFSPSAQAAGAQGKQVAEVIEAVWKGETPKLGQIKLRGVLGSLGKKSGFGLMGKKTVMLGMVPRALKSGVLWKSRRHFG
ncbi:NAD(P)/FAD-dependent oxidoreductase [Paenibacillus sp. J31TS4]|uniref:NAD(P)/FAD-dependent oxidoreductase n=1 Tax=Paenibacillus sp. J31TS4 TaxID=2807195 RepID=UPI001BCA9A41|nr:FAD-dependent oxidoreductase [Paenibacillus sp. J31TS4]